MADEGNTWQLDLTSEVTTPLIEDATDHYIAELETFIVSKLGLKDTRLRHACPVCHSRLANHPRALYCGHVFCSECCGKLVIDPSDASTTDSSDSEDVNYTCGVCRTVSNGSIKLFL